MTVLHLAIERGSAKLVELVIEKGANMDIENTWGRRPLGTTTMAANTDAVRVLLHYSAADVSKFLTTAPRTWC